MAEMTVSATEHYERLLAKHYSWMAGDFKAKVAQQRDLLEGLGVRAGWRDEASLALDLGCGSGFQTLALAELGLSVSAVDASATLLEELRGHVAGTTAAGNVTTFECDLAALGGCAGLPAVVDAAVCMGDTLSHLASQAEVSEVFGDVARRLRPGGLFVVGYRDLSVAAVGLNRFIPVRADEGTIMTCFLDFRDDEPESVVVTDLIYTRGNAGWVLARSAYRKLRLSLGWVRSELVRAGLAIEREQTVMGMAILVAAKRA